MKCGDKEWQHCRVEKMGCTGCYYDEIESEEYIRTESGHIFKVDKEKRVLQGIKFLDMQYGKIVDHNKDIRKLIKIDDLLKYKVNSNFTNIDNVKEFFNPTTNKKYLGVSGWGLEQIKILKLIPKEQFKIIGYDIEEV